MIDIINQWFDWCNGKCGNNMFLRFNKYNGEEFSKKILSVLQWFNDWEKSIIDRKQSFNEFITKETYRSLKYICYGYACLIKFECLDKDSVVGISPSTINQDICEHHFANVRRNCSSHSNPNEIECMKREVLFS